MANVPLMVPVTLWGYVAVMGFGGDWGSHVAEADRGEGEDVRFAE